MKRDPENTYNRIDKAERRKRLRCSVCPPNRGENACRRAKHGSKKSKYKSRRRGKL